MLTSNSRALAAGGDIRERRKHYGANTTLMLEGRYREIVPILLYVITQTAKVLDIGLCAVAIKRTGFIERVDTRRECCDCWF